MPTFEPSVEQPPSARYKRTANAIVAAERLNEFANDYQRMTSREMQKKWAYYFGDLTDKQVSNELTHMRKYLELPAKRRTANSASAQKKRVTPQSVEQAFKVGKTVAPDHALQTLATALLPYLRDALLDDLATSIGLVRKARGQ